MRRIASSQSGMSLVEVLVALFILALASAAIVMTLPRQASRIDREVARLEQAIERLSDESVSSGEVRGLRLQDTGYSALAWRADEWVFLDRTFRRLTPPVTLSVSRAESHPPGWPDIMADMTGVVTARDFILADGADQRRVSVSSSGAVRVER